MNALRNAKLARALVALGAGLALHVAASARANAQTPADLVVVPLTFPGDDAPFESAATTELVARLRAAGADVKVAKPTDPFALAATANALCAQNGAHAIVTGRLRVEQTSTSGSLAFLPYVGPLAKVLVNTHPSHAVAALDRIGCDGRVLARAIGASDEVHHGSNVGAGVTVAVKGAIDVAVSNLVVAPDDTTRDLVWLQTGAHATTDAAPKSRPQSAASDPGAPAGGATFVPSVAVSSLDAPAPNPKRLAVTAVQDTLDPDPHEAFATSSELVHLQTLGYDVAETAPLDRFEIASRASEICAVTGASRILAGALRYEQSAIDNFFSTSYPTHAFLHFDLLGCDGAVLHSEDVTSDIRYQFANVGAAISKALDDGVVTGLKQVGLTGEAPAAH